MNEVLDYQYDPYYDDYYDEYGYEFDDFSAPSAPLPFASGSRRSDPLKDLVLPSRATPSSMSPGEAYEYSQQMADLWEEQLSFAEEEAWEAERDAIKAAYHAEMWTKEEKERQKELADARAAEQHATEQRKVWQTEQRKKEDAKRAAEEAEVEAIAQADMWAAQEADLARKVESSKYDSYQITMRKPGNSSQAQSDRRNRGSSVPSPLGWGTNEEK